MSLIPRWIRYILVLVLLSLATGGTWFYRTQEQQLRGRVEQELIAIARLKVNQIVEWRTNQLGAASELMANTFLSRSMTMLRAAPHAETQGGILSYFRSLQKHYHYHDVLLVAQDGRILLSLSGTSGRGHIEILQDLDAALRERKPALTDLNICEVDSAPHISVIAPLFGDNGSDQSSLGAVIMISNARQYLYPLIQTWPTLSKTAETLLVRREGDHVLFLNDLRHQPGAALRLRLPLSRTEVPAVMAVLGKKGIADGKDYRGVDVVSNAIPISDSPWFMVAKVDATEAFAEWRSRSALIIGLLLGMALLGGTGVLIAWQRNEKAHFRGLYQSEAALRVSERNLSIRNAISQVFFTLPSEEMYSEVLKIILAEMQSSHGIFGYIDEEGALVVPSMTRDTWDKCRAPEKSIVFPRNTWGNSSWPCAIREKKLSFSNKASELIPEGHIAIRRHISLPILFQGEVVGLLQVANKESDYTQDDLHFLDAISQIIAPVLDARLKNDRQEAARQRTLADLERSNKDLEQFAYVASHDLQEPLRTVSSYTQLLAQRYEGQLDQDARDYIGYAVDGANRMQQLIQDLLAYSRITTRGSLFVPVDLNEALGEAIANLRASIHESDAIVANGDLPTINADHRQFVQVFQNLIGNGIKFRKRDEPPRVHITADRAGREWIISVKDNGIGIDPQYFNRLFIVFQRLHGKQEYSGSGIGLALCKRIVERHGGRIWVESALGEGATFRFTIKA